MTKYVQTQTRKVLSSYGGVGSIIETTEGAIKIEKFNEWKFFNKIKRGDLEINNFKIEDNRLITRLQKSFPKLDSLIQVPFSYPNPTNPNKPKNEDEVISGKYFPEWFYCNKCNKFMKLNNWFEKWRMTSEKYNIEYKSIIESFIAPKCYKCFDEAKKNNLKRTNYQLEQVRFIMTSPTGKIQDVPWERWVSAQKDIDVSEDKKTEVIKLDNNLCCANQDLYYIKSNKFSDLAGIRIECKSCNKKNTLAGLFALKLPIKNTFYKVVIRTSNSVYYPIIVNSIYLPAQREISPSDQDGIKEWISEGEDLEFIYKALRKKYSIEIIEKFIKFCIKKEFESEVEYRLKEYNFIINKESYNDKNEDNKNKLIFERQNILGVERYNLKHLYSIKKLTMTTVQTGYTRQEPLDKDIFLRGEEDKEETKIKAKYTSSYEKNTNYLPAIENLGEGIFIAFEKEQIDNWILNLLRDQPFNKRIENLLKNCENHDYPSIQTKFKNVAHLTKFVFIHTLSHILIKEFEFLCGYPSTSLNERLFVDENNMQGLLIYTVAGSEGSYGGLVSQSKPEKFFRILNSAINRSKDCASDPICYNTEDGQGVGGLNMASCYSCSLLPENACEEFNSFLDRALLIDPNYGFFQ